MYAGTLAMEVLTDVLSIPANHRDEFSIIHIDVSRAHFHAKAQQFLLVSLPNEDMGTTDAGKHRTAEEEHPWRPSRYKQFEMGSATPRSKLVLYGKACTTSVSS